MASHFRELFCLKAFKADDADFIGQHQHENEADRPVKDHESALHGLGEMGKEEIHFNVTLLELRFGKAQKDQHEHEEFFQLDGSGQRPGRERAQDDIERHGTIMPSRQIMARKKVLSTRKEVRR